MCGSSVTWVVPRGRGGASRFSYPGTQLEEGRVGTSCSGTGGRGWSLESRPRLVGHRGCVSVAGLHLHAYQGS